MNRRSWLRWLPAVLVPAALKGDEICFKSICREFPTATGGGEGHPGVTLGTPILEWRTGRALNNQCPVCGTMATPYLRQTYFEEYGHLIGTLPPISKSLFGAAFDFANISDRVNEDDAIKRPTEMVGPDHMNVRCAQCNCQFVQDADR